MTDPTPRSDRSFPPTVWALLISARDPDSADFKQARENLCQAYWQPVHSYLLSLGLTDPDAQDVTQNVLADFCRDSCLEKLDEAKGRLRHFFKAAARHALASHFRSKHRLKRGGNDTTLSLDDLGDAPVPGTPSASDESFDQQWAWTVFEQAMNSLAASYAARGKETLFSALKFALISPESMKPYAEIGSAFDMSEQQIRLEVHRLRKRMAEQLRAHVTATLHPSVTPAEIEFEMRYLIQALAHERAC